MNKEKQNIPQGYKDSVQGVIPQDWEVKRLGDVCKVNQGLQIPIEDRLKNYVEGSYKYITIQFLNNGKAAEYILCTNDSVICTKDDVLMTRTGNTGIVISNVDGVFHNNFFKIDFDRTKINKEFLISYLTQSKTQHIILVKAGISTIPDLNHKDFYSIYLPIPPLEEQQRIAEVLGCWDEAIEKQARMVDLLTTRKRALMQRLLMPQPHWKETELGDLLDYEQPTKYIVSNTEYKEQYNIPVLTAGKTFILGYTNENFGVFTNLPVILFDDFITASRLVNFPFKVKSSATKLLHIKGENDIRFIYSSMQQINYVIGGHERHWISKYAYIIIPVPSLAEQKAIAEKLSTADAEIDLARRHLDLLRTQKRALMQQLLTGKKRLKIDEN